MIPHIHTLFEFISIPYENQHQTLNIKKIDRGQIRFRDYWITLLQPKNGGGLGKNKNKRKEKHIQRWNKLKTKQNRKQIAQSGHSTRLEIPPAVSGTWRWSNDIRHALAELRDRDLRLRQTMWIRSVILVTKVMIISSIVYPSVHPSVMLCFC